MRTLLVSSPPSSRGGISNWVRLIKEYTDPMNTEAFELRLLHTRTYKGLKPTKWERFAKNGLDLFKLSAKLKEACIKARPDVIHITCTGDWAVLRDILLLKIAAKYHIPTVYHMHFGMLPEYKRVGGRRWKFLQRALPLASEIWAIDMKTQGAVKDSYPDKLVRYMPNPVALHDLPEATDSKENIIIYVGWLVKTKGIEELLSAWAIVHKEYPDYRLRLIGPYQDEYLVHLKENFSFDGVEVTGRLDHADAMINMEKSRVYVLPSYTEGFPNGVIEAMSLRVPVLATDVGAIADILSGGCGVVLEPQRVNEIVEKLRDLLARPECCEAMAERAYQKAMNIYSIDVVMGQYFNAWEELCSKERDKQ